LNEIDNVVVVGAAVGAARGTIRLHRYKRSNLGRHSVLVDHGYGSRTVPLLELDRALDDLGVAQKQVAILKIDVEGYEPEVIAGAARTLQRTDAILLEYSPGLSRGGRPSLDGMCDRLAAAGFSPFGIRADGTAEPLTLADVKKVDDQIDLVFLRANPGAR
jgi:hypothetical protein